MINVDTAIKEGDGFVHISDAKPARGQDHVQGAILLQIDDVPILDETVWDDVNWLWPLLIEAVDQVRAGRPGELMFPDQPITMTFTPRPGGSWVRVELSAEGLRRGGSARRDELLAAVKAGAIEFFEALRHIAPREAVEKRYLLDRVRSW